MKLNDIIEKLEEIYEAMLVDDEHQEALDQAIERLGDILQSERTKNER